jgi:hypothetical protein
MAFVCTVENVVDLEIFRSGSSSAIVFRVGHDDDQQNMKTYSAVLGLTPQGGGDLEFYFHLLEVDDETGAEYIYWSGKDVAKFIGPADRHRILEAILAATAELLTRIAPQKVHCCTHDQHPPDRALVKHFLIANVFEECGYEVHTSDPYHGKRVWWMERRPEADVAPASNGV